VPFEVSLTWTPQSKVWVALALSAVALVGCLALALWPRPQRRRGLTGLTGDDTVPDDQPQPDIVSPLSISGPTGTRPLVIAATAVGTGIAAGLVITPPAGVFVGALTALAFALRRGRALLRFGALACLAITAAYVVELQWHYSLPLNGSWPATFSKVATISWLAVALLGADVVVEAVQRQRPRRAGGR
jgi:arabinofuranan 3-O-arabinosyltransferase